MASRKRRKSRSKKSRKHTSRRSKKGCKVRVSKKRVSVSCPR